MPGRRPNENVECKVYVGNLGEHPPLKKDLEYEFSYFGPLVDVWIARSPPGFAYIEFEDREDALAACEALDGKKFDDRTLRVEMARHNGPRGGGRRSRSRDRSRERGGGRGGRRRRSRSYSSDSYDSRDSRDDRRDTRYRRRSGSRDRYDDRDRYDRDRRR